MSYSFGEKKTTVEETVLETLRMCFDSADINATRSYISRLMSNHGEDTGSFTNIFLREVLVIALHGVEHTGSEDGGDSYHLYGHQQHHHSHQQNSAISKQLSSDQYFEPTSPHSQLSLLGTVALPTLSSMSKEYYQHPSDQYDDEDSGSGSDIPSHSSAESEGYPDEEGEEDGDEGVFEDEANLIPGKVGHTTPLVPPLSTATSLAAESLTLLFDEIFIAVTQCVATETQRQRDDASASSSSSTSSFPIFTPKVAHRLAEDLTALPVLRPPPNEEQLMLLRWQHALNNHSLLANQPMDAAFVSLAAEQIQQLVQDSLRLYRGSSSSSSASLSEVEESINNKLDRSPYNPHGFTYSTGSMQFDDSETDTTDASSDEDVGTGNTDEGGEEEGERWMLIPAQEDVRSAPSSVKKSPPSALQNAQQMQARLLTYQVAGSDSDNDNTAHHYDRYDRSLFQVPADTTEPSSSASTEVWNTPGKALTEAIESADGYIAPWDLPMSPMENFFRRGYGGLGQDNLDDVIDLLEGDQEPLPVRNTNEVLQAATAEEEEEEMYHKLHSSGEVLPTVPIPVARCRFDLDSDSENDQDGNEDSICSGFVLSPMTQQAIPEAFTANGNKPINPAAAIAVSLTNKSKVAANGKKSQSAVTKAVANRKQPDAEISLDLLSPARPSLARQAGDSIIKDKQQLQKRKKVLSRANSQDKKAGEFKKPEKALPSVAAVPEHSNPLPLPRSKKQSSGTKVTTISAVSSSSAVSSMTKLQQWISSQQQHQQSLKEPAIRLKKKVKSSSGAVAGVIASSSSSSSSSGPVNTALSMLTDSNNFDATGLAQEVSQELQSIRHSLGSVKEIQSSILQRAEQALLSLRPPIAPTDSSSSSGWKNPQPDRMNDPIHEELEEKLWSSEIQLLDDLPIPQEDKGNVEPSLAASKAEPHLPFDSTKSTSLNVMMRQSFRAHVQQYSKNQGPLVSDSIAHDVSPTVSDVEPRYMRPTHSFALINQQHQSEQKSYHEKESRATSRSKSSSVKNSQQQQLPQQQQSASNRISNSTSDNFSRKLLRRSLSRPLSASVTTSNNSSNAAVKVAVSSSSTGKGNKSNHSSSKTSKRSVSAPRVSMRSSN